MSGVDQQPPDWQLPAGVSPGLWQYFLNDKIAKNYEATLNDSFLPRIDIPFVEEHCRPPGRMIDLGCGTGRLHAHLAKRGYRVVGIDLSPAMLSTAREKAASAGLAIDVIQANIVELGCLADGVFDYAVCLFSTLGMVQGADNRRRMIQHAHRLLRPGGVFVLHVHNRWFDFWHPGGCQMLWEDTLRRFSGRAEPGDRDMPGHGNMPPLNLHLFTRGEARQLLSQTGFAIRETRAIGLKSHGKLRWPGWFGWLRAYGYLFAAAKKPR